MDELYNLGISDNTIKAMLEANPEIKKLTSKEIIEKIMILDKINCSKTQIGNIIGSNPNYLTKTNEEIIELITYLAKLNLTTLNILFDANPYILDLEPSVIEEYIKKRINSGEKLYTIIDDLDGNPYLFNEI